MGTVVPVVGVIEIGNVTVPPGRTVPDWPPLEVEVEFTPKSTIVCEIDPLVEPVKLASPL